MNKKYLVLMFVFLSFFIAQKSNALTYTLTSKSFDSLLKSKAVRISGEVINTRYPLAYSNSLLVPRKEEKTTITFDSTQDALNPLLLKASQSIAMKSTNDFLNLGEIKIETRINGDIVYIKVPSIVFKFVGIDIKEDTWISIDSSDIQTLQTDWPSIKEFHKNFKETATSPQKIIDARKNSLLNFSQSITLKRPVLKNENGRKLTTYSVNLDKKALRKALIAIKSEAYFDKKIPKGEIQEVDTLLASFNLKPTTLTIENGSLLPQSIIGSIDSFNASTKKITSTTSFKIFFDRYNTPLSIEASQGNITSTNFYNTWIKPKKNSK